MVSLNVVCGAWAGFLIAALWYGHQELARLREVVRRLETASQGTCDPAESGQLPLWTAHR
jgi:hypothetical protein